MTDARDLTTDYENGAFIPDAASYPPRWTAEAAAFRAALGPRATLDIAYGPAPRNRYDLFAPEGPAKGTVIFLHGGYWKAFDKSSWSHFSAGVSARGWSVAMPSYTLAPNARIAEITAEIAAAVTHIAARTRGPIAVTGHSAGGHLAARMLTGVLPPEITDRITACVPISPVADLAPLLQTDMNAVLNLTPEEARAESPVRLMPAKRPTTVVVGAEERPVFLTQAMDLADAWGADLIIPPGRHHFDVLDPLTDPESRLVKTLTRPLDAG